MHSFKKGDQVTVFNSTLGGKIFVEGKVTVVRPIKDVDEQYVVKFPDGKFERFVDPLGQDDPYEYVAQVNRVTCAAA